MAAMFEHLVRVRWRDTDALGHVNHAVFLTYLEEGRDAFYVQFLGSDPNYVVVRLEVDLRAEVHYPDQQVAVRIQAERLARGPACWCSRTHAERETRSGRQATGWRAWGTSR